MTRFKWGNIPIPEGHMVLLAARIALHLWRPLQLISAAWLVHALGWPFLLLGVLLIAWCLAVANDITIDQPDRLITSGPYASSPNPMFIAWTQIYLAAAYLVNTRRTSCQIHRFSNPQGI